MRIIFIAFLLINYVNGELIRDNITNTVLDTNTLIMWQDDEDSKTLELTWQDSIDYCENNVSLAGYTNWRLPNVNELNYIIDNSIHSPAINSIFVNIESYTGGFWSSTTYMKPNVQNEAWYVDFIYGDTKTRDKSLTNHVRCIRNFN